MSLKLGNLICVHAEFAKFIYKTLDICSQRLFPFALRYTFPLFVQLFVGIYGFYLKFDLGPLALISILFINMYYKYFIENVQKIANVKEYLQNIHLNPQFLSSFFHSTSKLFPCKLPRVFLKKSPFHFAKLLVFFALIFLPLYRICIIGFYFKSYMKALE